MDKQHDNTENHVNRIYADISDAQSTLDSFDLDEQPGAADKPESIAKMARALSTALNDLCNCEYLGGAA
jgi:hypothetical protein